MIIDSKNEGVLSLLKEWQTIQPLAEEDFHTVQLTFQRALVQEVINPAIAAHPGELALFYHKSLRLVPSGEHSFALGSKMMSEYIYWVTVARIKSDMFLSLVETKEKPFTIGRDRAKISVALSPRFLIPVEWKIHLEPRYRDSHSPYFVVADSVNEKQTAPITDTESGLLDVSAFDHLFRFGMKLWDDLSWATEIFLVFGDESVKAWLANVGSPPDVYEKLVHWQADNADTQAPSQE